MANLLVKGARLLAVGAALSSLQGCMLDPAGIGLTIAQAAYTPDEPEPIDYLTPLKDMYRPQDCSQLTSTDGMLRLAAQQPGEHSTLPTALEAIRQVKAEKGCPAEAQVAATAQPAPGTATTAAAGAALTAPVAAGETSGRGWLGAALLPGGSLHAALVRDLGMPDGHGVLVTGVVPGTAAARAGVKAADVIQSVDGLVFDQADKLVDYLAASKAGTPVTLKIWRNHTSITFNATLAATQPPPVYAAQGALIYCYAQAMPDGVVAGGSSYWLSKPFAVPGATVNTAAERGKVVGQQFKQYLLSQGVNPASVNAAYGMCSQGIGNAMQFLEATEKAQQSGPFVATNSTSVTILWQP